MILFCHDQKATFPSNCIDDKNSQDNFLTVRFWSKFLLPVGQNNSFQLALEIDQILPIRIILNFAVINVIDIPPDNEMNFWCHLCPNNLSCLICRHHRAVGESMRSTEQHQSDWPNVESNRRCFWYLQSEPDLACQCY